MRKEIACVILILLAACVNKPGQHDIHCGC